MMAELKKRIFNLLSIKSIVTVFLTGVFCYMAIVGMINAESVEKVVWMVIAFYFGTQAEKKAVN